VTCVRIPAWWRYGHDFCFQLRVFVAHKMSRGRVYYSRCISQFNSVINRLFKKDKEARQRQLRLRTFAVLPLREDCGLIEWVPDTVAVRHVLMELQTRLNVGYTFADVRQMHQQVRLLLSPLLD